MRDKYKQLLKKYLPYAAVLIVGILLGSIVWKSDSPDQLQTKSDNSKTIAGFTCSMHPQIQNSTMGSCPLCGMELVPISDSGDVSDHQFRMTDNAIALADIRTHKIGGIAEQNGSLRLSGKITSNMKTDAIQTTLFDGRIESLNINSIGQYIREGQEIGIIYSPELYLAQDKLLTSASYKDTHQKLFDAARNSLGLWKLTDEQIEEILRTGKPKVNFPLYADVSGTVTEIFASEGNFYKQGDPLFKLSKLNTVWAVFDAYESQLPFLNVGQEISIQGSALKGAKIIGKIDFIEPILDNSKRTVAIRVTLRNSERKLKPGMFVQGNVTFKGHRNTIMVPKSAVLWTGKRSLVYLKPKPMEPVFEMTEVTLGQAIGESYEILEGLNIGDEIVVNGTFTVDAAAQLSGKKSMMNQQIVPSSPPDNEELPIIFEDSDQEKLLQMIGSYLELKDALVGSDIEKARKEAENLLERIRSHTFPSLNSEVSGHFEKLQKYAREISLEEDLEKKRLIFKPLSEEMVAIASYLGDLDRPIYVQFCPMADDNAGAPWLSWENEIRNPYFGDKMLTCGVVTDKIQ